MIQTPRSLPAPLAAPLFATSWRALVLALLCSACAYEVIPLDAAPSGIPTLPAPLPFTVAVGVRSFEGKLIKQEVFVPELARRIKGSQVFEGLIYPVPAGFDTTWQFELAIREQAKEGPYNGLKSAVAAFFSPLGFFIHMQTEYEVAVEGQLMRKHQLVASYPVSGKLRYRYQINTDGKRLEQDVLDTVLDRTTRLMLQAIVADADHIRKEERARAGK